MSDSFRPGAAPSAVDPVESDEMLEVWSRATKRQTAFAPLIDIIRIIIRDRYALVSTCIVGLFLLMALFAGVIAPYDPQETFNAPDGRLLDLERPSAEHWLGTTAYSKDVFSQVVIGSRVAFIVGISAAIAVGLISTTLGMISGYYGRRIDDVIMRLTDFALSIPTLPIAIVAVAILGPSLRNIILVIVLLFWRNGTRIVRSVVLTEKEKLYVQAARSAGASNVYIMMRHILPNVIPVAVLWMTMSIAFAILAEASLSFLGLGDPNTVTWGQMLNLAFTTGAMRTAWWWVVPPSLCLVMMISSIYMVGRAIEEKTNPRLRKA